MLMTPSTAMTTLDMSERILRGTARIDNTQNTRYIDPIESGRQPPSMPQDHHEQKHHRRIHHDPFYDFRVDLRAQPGGRRDVMRARARACALLTRRFLKEKPFIQATA
jgi:hypothetical protein